MEKLPQEEEIIEKLHPYQFLAQFFDAPENQKKDENAKEEEPNKLINFANTEIAMDNSGSTSGSVLKKCKDLIKIILANNPDKDQLVQNVLAWNSSCQRMNLNNISSYGGTQPSCIFYWIKNETQNILMTTDGEIFESDLNVTRMRLSEHPHIKNVVSILVMDQPTPSSLNLSVFYPFLEHTRAMGGCFYLLCRRLSDSIETEGKLYLLMKEIPEDFQKFDKLPKPLERYEFSTQWSEVPLIKYEDINEILVPSKYDLAFKGILTLKDKKTRINLITMESCIQDDILLKEEFTEFLRAEFPGLIDKAIEKNERKILDLLRKIVQKWKTANSNVIQQEVDKLRSETGLDEYEKLLDEKFKEKDRNSENFKRITQRLGEISDKAFNACKMIEKIKIERTDRINSIFDQLMKMLSSTEINVLNLNSVADFTLQNVTSQKISNRAKRAEMLENTEKLEEWDLSGNNCLCEECLICARENQPCALLMLDLKEIDRELLEKNLTDEALNDEITAGMENVKVIPAGEFCVSCAYTLFHSGSHPITRKKIASVLVLCDPFKGSNLKLITRSVCTSIFGGKAIPGSYQILLGLFDQLRKNEEITNVPKTNEIPEELQIERRFSKGVYEYINRLALNLGKGKLLKEAGESKNLLLAMYDVINFKLVKTDPESWLIPMRNKNFVSVSLFCRSLIENFGLLIKKGVNTTMLELMQQSINYMRRIFIKECFKKIITQANKRQLANRFRDPNVIKGYQDFIFTIESDLFDNATTAIPLAGSEKVVKFDGSNTIKFLFGSKDDKIVEELKYFEKFIQRIYRDRNKDGSLEIFKDFELLPTNLMTILILGIYRLLTKSGSQNQICVKDEKFLKEFFLEYMKLDKDKNSEIASLAEEISDVFFEGNFGHLNSLTENELKDLVRLVSPYSKISKVENEHINFLAQFADHCYSAPVTVCSVCGKKFITDEEKQKIIEKTTRIKTILEKIVNEGIRWDRIPQDTQNLINDISKLVKERRNKHFQEVFGSLENQLLPGENSALVSYHEIVRTVLFKRRFKQCKKVKKEMIEEELNYARSKADNKKGNIYQRNLPEKLLALTVDLINKRNKEIKRGRNFINRIMFNSVFGKFADRVIYEVNIDEELLYVGKPASLENVKKEIIDECLKSYNHYPVSKSEDVLPIYGISKFAGLREQRKEAKEKKLNQALAQSSNALARSNFINNSNQVNNLNNPPFANPPLANSQNVNNRHHHSTVLRGRVLKRGHPYKKLEESERNNRFGSLQSSQNSRFSGSNRSNDFRGGSRIFRGNRGNFRGGFRGNRGNFRGNRGNVRGNFRGRGIRRSNNRARRGH